MNTKHFFLNTVLLCALSLGSNSMAQETKIYNPSGKQLTNRSFRSSHKSVDNIIFDNAKKAINSEDNELFTVTINLEYDPELFWDNDGVSLINYDNETNPFFYCWDIGDGICQGEVPTGTYDIIATFRGSTTDYYVIKEQVDIDSDLSLTININEADNLITTNNFDPDGNLLKHGLGHWDEVTGEWITDEESEIIATAVLNLLYIKDFGTFETTGCDFIGEMDTEEMRTCPLNIYVNDVSNHFVFAQSRITFTNDASKSYCSWFSTDDVNNGIRENNANNYIQYESSYLFTPYGLTQDGYGKEITLWNFDKKNRASQFSYADLHYEPKQGEVFHNEIWVNVPDADPYCNEIKLFLNESYADYDGLVTNNWSGEEYTDMIGWTIGMPVLFQDGEPIIINMGHHRFSNGGFIQLNNLYNNNSMNNQLLPYPEPYSYTIEKIQGFINDNCPINALKIQTYENNDQMKLDITNYFVGRFGETRWCNEGTTAITKFNGTEVDMESFTPDNKGTYEITVTNPNIEVDGLPGHNTTTVYFDQNQEDMTPPSIEMLHFKNGNGEITDRFATNADGIIEFYASDFDYHYYPDMWNGLFEVKPVEIHVEYAPYNTDNWTELTVEEVPELFQEPGWGYFYRGSLAGVTGQAEKGWFDLKFRLEDAAGNWQEQVVSPAFRIDDLAITGINEITQARHNDDNTIYNIAGQRMNGDINSLPRGIYIVGGKKIVK